MELEINTIRSPLSHSLTLSNSPEHQDAGLLDDPIGMEKQAFEQGEEMRQQLFTKHISKNIESGSRTLP